MTCQSAIKLSHVESGGKYFLNSSNQNYGGGSGQQVVSVIPKASEHSSLWTVREGHEKPLCEAGTPVECGSIIRLTHSSSGKNLHSHSVRASISGQQEVSGFGMGDGHGDGGDDWKVVCMGGYKYWQRGKEFRLMHMATRKYLGGAKDKNYNERNCGNCPILHHLEAFARGSQDQYSLWTVSSGVHLSFL